MRIRVFMSGVFLLCLSAAPAVVRAQFQAPTDEELKMTSDPKAPGADAVYLYVEEIDNDPMHYQSFYARIKILSEKAKDLATVDLPYLKGNTNISDIKGRTIHADGTVIPLNVKPEDLLLEKKGEKQFKQKAFSLPSVEVGSILEYRWEERYDDNEFSSPFWEIQRKYFVRKAHYSFTPFEQFKPNVTEYAGARYLIDENGNPATSLIWWYNLPPGVVIKTDIGGHYTVDLTDIPPIPDEEWMPPIQSLLYKVFFYYKGASSASDFWVATGKRWQKEVNHFAEPTKSIQEAAAGVVGAGDSEMDKAEKLYKAVQALDNTDYSRAKGESELKQLKIKAAKRAEDTWNQKSGSSDDIALLYLAMLRGAGLTAYALKVVDRERGVFDSSYMSTRQLDDMMVVLSIGGKQVVLDPGEKMCPFGTLNWRHSNTKGLAETDKGVLLGGTPEQAYTANVTKRSGTVNVDEHGVVAGTISFVYTGQEALHWRQAALENDEAEVKKRFDHELESIVPGGVEAHVDHFLAMDDPDKNLVAIVKVSGTLGTATSKRVLLPGFFFETRSRNSFVNQEKRLEPVDMQYAALVSDQITYQLPSSLKVEGAPADANIIWKDHAAEIVKSKAGPDQITIARTLARGFTEAKPEEYQDLRGFYQKVAASDQQELVLAAASAAAGKGN